MNINEFNDDYLNELLDKLSKQNKTINLLDDFNINLLNYDIHPTTKTPFHLITFFPIFYSLVGLQLTLKH